MRTKYFVACAGDKITKGSAGTWSDITNTGITPILGTYWDAVTFDNELWLVNESVKLQAWNGASSATATPADYPATNTRYIELHKNRLWAACSDSHPNRLYFSSLRSGSNWSTTGGYIDVAADDGDKITGLVSMGGYLYVIKQNAIYLIYGNSPNEFGVRKTSSAVGAIAPRSIVKVRHGIMFLGRSNVYFFNGSTSESVSTKIEATIASWEEVQKTSACAIFDNKNHYRLSVAEENSSLNNAEYIYDTTLKEWYRNGDEYFDYYCIAEGAGDKSEIYGGSSQNDGIVWQLTGETGFESYIHKTQTDLKTGVTFNTIHGGTELSPTLFLNRYNRIDSQTHLFLDCDGTDASTVFTDASLSSHGNATVNEAAQVDTAFYKEGTGSLLLDGDNDYLTYADSDDWDVMGSATDDWTVSMWVRHDDHVGTERYIGQTDGNNYWTFQHSHGSGFGAFVYDGASILNMSPTTSTDEIEDSGWHHIALIKVGTTWGAYLDGEQVNYAVSSGTLNISGLLYIGSDDSAIYYFDGRMDNIKIQNSNIFDAAPNSGKTDTIKIDTLYVESGTLTSDNLEINASGQAALASIYWQETVPLSTDIQMTCRTGATDDSVYYTGWEPWVSTSTIISPVSNATAWTSTVNFPVSAPTVMQLRNVLYYEPDDKVSPDCVVFVVSGDTATDNYAYTTIPSIDLSAYKFIGYWLKSPVTGSMVRIGLGEAEGNELTITANTVEIDTWEKHWWPIDIYTNAELDAIKHLKVWYAGDTFARGATGSIVLSDIYAYDFLDSSETITSTPNDWIQYKAILGATDNTVTPQLRNANDYVITLQYSPAGTQESSMTSDYYTHWLDMKSPQVNKTFYDLFMLIKGDTDSTVKVNYDIDYGDKTGTMWYDFEGTDTTNRLHEWFDAGQFGKRIKFHIQATSTTAKNSIRQLETRFRKHPFSPD